MVQLKAKPSGSNLDTSEKKFREAILYVAEKSQGDETFGATKLNKLLFYSDFLAYLNFGKAITDQEYFRLPKGPAPRKLLPVRKKLEQEGAIKVEAVRFFGFPQDRVIPLRQADYSVFTADEMALMDRVIEMHRNKTASEISEESHGFVGWSLARDRETIPYSVALVHCREPKPKEIAHAKSLAPIAAALLSRGCDSSA